MVVDTISNTIFLLTGDIGGTNSRMSLYDASESECSKDTPLAVYYYRNKHTIPDDCHGHADIFEQKIVIPFLKYCWEENEESKAKLPPLHQVQILATLATAGIVANNQAKLTNLGDMLVDGNAIADNYSDPYLKHIVVCHVLNDFVAVRTGSSGDGRTVHMYIRLVWMDCSSVFALREIIYSHHSRPLFCLKYIRSKDTVASLSKRTK
jgi:glucokinase